MDPMFKGEWSAYEIMAAKSVITSYNPENNYADETNKKHNAIVSDLQAWFPWREKSQVTKLYIELVAKMMQEAQSGNQSMVAINNLVNQNFEIQVEDPPMDTIDMLPPNQTDMTLEAMRMMEEAPQQQLIIPYQEGQNKTGIWTKAEHWQFLFGLSIHGRGKWKEISRDFVTTRTPAQVSNHAQKYFRRKECTSKKQRYSINDVTLFDAEPWMQTNSAFSQDVHTIGGGAYNPNCFGSSSQLDNMNNLAQWSPFLYSAGQASSSQVSTWTGQQMGASSSPALELEGDGSHEAWTGNQQGEFLPEQWMDTENMYY